MAIRHLIAPVTPRTVGWFANTAGTLIFAAALTLGLFMATGSSALNQVDPSIDIGLTAARTAPTPSGIALGGPSTAAGSPTADEALILGAINVARAEAGLAPYAHDPSLAAAAREWSQTMADENRLHHTSDLWTGASSAATRCSENVAVAFSATQAMELFLDSPPHRAAILDAQHSQAGIGVVWVEGTIWVTQRFQSIPTATPLNPPAPPPPASQPPLGSLDISAAVPTNPDTIYFAGWAFDNDVDRPIAVHLYVDGVFGTAVPASASRPDVAAVMGSRVKVGFNAIFQLTPGVHTVCAFAINEGPVDVNPMLGCLTLNVLAPSDHTPVGSLDVSVQSAETANSVYFAGWAYDTDVDRPIAVHLYVDGVFGTAVPASAHRPDVAAVTGSSPKVGFNAVFELAPGPHTICAFAINEGLSAPNPLLGCLTVQ